MEHLLEHLRTFIGFRSIAGSNTVKRECLDWIYGAFLQQSSLKPQWGVHDGAPYLWLAHAKPSLIWFAHTDVIPASDDLFSLRVEGEHAYGRGVKDMKGAALPFLLAYRDLCMEGKEPPVSVLLTSDEEIGGRTIPMLLEKHTIDAPAAFTPDSGSTPHIVTEHKGAVWAKLTAMGKGTHGAMPWDGDNPIYLLSNALGRLQEAFPSGKPDEWRMTISPTELHGSDARNKVPDTASCTLDIRFPPEVCKTVDEALALIRKELPPGCTVEAAITVDPLWIDPAHPMVLMLQRIASDVTGTPVTIGREHGATDARFFAANGIPAFLYGPIGGGIHTEEEWVSVQSLHDQYEINKRWMLELSSL